MMLTTNPISRLTLSALLAVLANVILTCALAQPVSAATYTVTNLGDGTASATRCPSITNCRLRDAIAKAVAGDTITFSVTGTITLTNSQLNLTRNVTINGPGATLLTISGNNVSRVFNINSGITVTISGLRIANGNSGTGNGGGILNAGSLTLTNSTINGNAGANGSGIYNSRNLTVTGSTLSSNRATTQGGGIYNAATVSLTNSTLTGNSGADGSAVYNTSSLTITNGTLSNNTNSAISNTATGTATLTGSTLSGSTSSGIKNSGVLFLTNSTLSGNSGSAISNNGTATIAGSTLSGNSTNRSGGGIENLGGTMTLTNSTISGNRAFSNGGGIANFATLNFTNCTITGNSTTSNSPYDPPGYGGGGVHAAAGTVNARNTLIAGNTVPAGKGGTDVLGALNSQGYNLIGNSSGATITGVTTGNILNKNALLSPLGNYGGPTQTHALLPGSPALNAGDNCVTVAGGCLAQPLSADQRGTGFLRMVNTTVDIGAFESRGFTMAIAGGNNQTALPYQNFPSPLSVTVTAVAAGEPVAGGQVTFTPPTTGASATIAGNPATIVGTTATTGTVTANNTRGVYSLLVQAGGPTVAFTLSNICSATNLVVTNNNSDGTGSLRAAIAGACPGSTITFTSSAFSIVTGGSPIVINQNVTIQGRGTGLLGISGSGNSPVFKINSGVTASISGMSIYNGFASSIYRGGGGIFNQGNLTLSNVVLSDSVATLGGGIYNQGTLTVNNSTVARNRAGAGGGIYNDAGSVTITGSTFTGNSSTGNGGGGSIYASGGTVALASSAIYNNSSATLGGGVSLYQATAAFTNSTLSGNSAKSRGGGIAQSGGAVTLTNSTLSSNSVNSTGTSFSPNGGGISNYGGILNARNTLIALNILSNNVTGRDVSGTVTSQGYNLIGDDRNATISGITTGNILNVNPRLTPLGDFGGPTPTHALLPGSPAIDAGDNCVAVTGGCLAQSLTSDQRGAGINRKTGNMVDIGAFESRGFRLAIASGNNQSTTINTAFVSLFSVTVTANGAGEPVSGGQVTFTPPVSGASCTVAGSPATISGSTATTGIVTANATAGGPYNVVANTRGATNITGVNFSLTNLPLSVLATASARTTGQLRGRKTTVASDYDGDGKSDLAVWRGDQGQWQILYSSIGETKSIQLGDSSSPNEGVPVTGDFDGDGKTDIAVFRRSGIEAGHWYILRSSDGEMADVYFGLGSDVPVPADYDGDGKTDIAVWRGNESNLYIQRSSDNQLEIASYGSDTPAYQSVLVPADYDGDGKADVAVFRRAANWGSYWHIRRSSDGAVVEKQWGLETDTPVPADYDGDGQADIAVWREADGNWHIIKSSDQQSQIIGLGNRTDRESDTPVSENSVSSHGAVPVPADYDGDGKTDIAVWRTVDGTWHIRRSGDQRLLIKTHGQPGYTPVTILRPRP